MMKKQLLLFTSAALLTLTACDSTEEKPAEVKEEKVEVELTDEEKLQELFEKEFKDKYESVLFNETGDKQIKVQLKNFTGAYGPAIRDRQIEAIADALQLIKDSGIEAESILVATKYEGNNTIKAEFDSSILNEVDDDFKYKLHGHPENFTTSYHEDNSIK